MNLTVNPDLPSEYGAATRASPARARRRSLWKGPLLITCLALLFPVLGSLRVADWHWRPLGFVIFGGVIFGIALIYQWITRTCAAPAYRAAVGIAFFTGFLLAWGNLVQWADVNPAAGLYFAVLVVGIIGAAVARLRPAGMALALLVTATTQGSILIMVLIWLLTREPQVTAWPPPVLRGVGANAVYGLLFAWSAWLFWKAARQEREPGAL